MKTLITHATAKVRGYAGQRNHRKIVDKVFETRDALNNSAAQMLAEMESNDSAIRRLRARNKELYTAIHHAKNFAGRVADFFLPH